MEGRLLTLLGLPSPRWHSLSHSPICHSQPDFPAHLLIATFISRHAGLPTHQMPTAGSYTPQNTCPNPVALPLPVSVFLLPTPASCKADIS